jgi:hypothetical protein
MQCNRIFAHFTSTLISICVVCHNDLLVFIGQLDTVEEVANEKEVGEKEVDTDCNHDIQIHDDLGHVCRVCGMIVRRADTIIDYQWKKVYYLLKICDPSAILSSFSNINCSLYASIFNFSKFLPYSFLTTSKVAHVYERPSFFFCVQKLL